MKHAFIIAALLMTCAQSFAATQTASNFEDPNNKFSEMGRAQKKPCPFKNAPAGNVESPRLIHADLQSPAPTFNSRSRGTRQII